MRRTWIIAAGLLLCVAAGIAVYRMTGWEPPRPPSPPGAHGAEQRDTGAFVDLVVNPAATPIRMYWRTTDGEDIRSLERLRHYVEQQGGRMRFAMNGGMYRQDRTPVGLFIQNGRLLSPLDTSSGEGNFYLKPNGIFLVRKGGTAAVVTTDNFTPASDIEYATQSGPMLLIGGAIHPVFKKDSESLNIRNGVGVRDDGTVVFAISRSPVTFYDFAEYFRSMGCRDALYLDGLVSRCYLPEKNWIQTDGDFGVMIGVME